MRRKWKLEVYNNMNITTIITRSSDYEIIEGKTERLANICLQANAGEYVSGKAAEIYMEPRVFSDLGLKLTWFEYPLGRLTP